MRRPAVLLATALAAVTLASCAATAPDDDDDDGGAGGAPPDSTTAMEVAEDARLEFRLMQGNEGAADTEECLARHPDTGGIAPPYEEGPDEPFTACADFDGLIYETTFAPAFVTGDQVSYIDYDYGTAGLPTVYVVFEEAGIEAWKAALGDGFATVEVLVGGRPYRAVAAELSVNDILQIGGLGTIGEAEAIATALATGEP